MRKLLLAVCLLIAHHLIAQQVDSMMNIYAENFPHEKMHIHFDKSMYTKGETIWYKVYLTADIYPSEISKNVYVDWFDNDGKLLAHTYYPVFESGAKGNFSIPENYSGSALQVKAYTKWMLNFDTAFLYRKTIQIDQLHPASAPVIKNSNKTSINFFPEGGDLVNDIESKLAFLAHDAVGLPVKVSGIITDNNGNFIDSFRSTYDGMGYLQVKLAANQTYLAKWQDAMNNTYIDTLPKAQSTGVVMQVQPLSGRTIFVLKKANDAPANFNLLNIVAHINQHLVYRSRLRFSVSNAARAEINTKDLPTGVLQITVFDSTWLPVAERVVFVNNQNYSIGAQLSVNEKSNNARGKNQFDVQILDSLRTNLSIAIIDADVVSNSTSIYAQLLLQSDVKGYLHEPSKYFFGKSDSLRPALDLVMLTHGWRRFKWTDILAGKLPKLAPNANEPDILQLKGKVFGNAYLQNIPNAAITTILQAKDSSVQFFTLPISRNGDFGKTGLYFNDTVKVFYQLSGDKALTDLAAVTIKNGLLPPHKLTTGAYTLYPSTSSFKNPFDSLQLSKQRFYTLEKDKLNKMLKAQQLDEVTVRTKTKSALEKLDQQFTTGLFSGGDAYQFNISDDAAARSAMSIFYYLQGKVAGLQINNNGGQPSLSWRGSIPDLYLNESRTEASVLSGISMLDVAYVKVYRPPFLGSAGGGTGGAIAVYTKRGSNNSTPVGKGLNYALLTGYTPYKEFYQPNYAQNNNSTTPDLRSTLYWKPFVITDIKNRTANIEFYNNDQTKRFRVIVEGINEAGKLIHFEKIVE